MAEERCPHSLVVDQCTECSPAPHGLTRIVHVSGVGDVFHRTPSCVALRTGRPIAAACTRKTHAPQAMHVTDALARGMGACLQCYAEYHHRSRGGPCLVRVDGDWRPGLVVEWLPRPANRWRGLVTYLENDERITTIKDPRDVRARVDSLP